MSTSSRQARPENPSQDDDVLRDMTPAEIRSAAARERRRLGRGVEEQRQPPPRAEVVRERRESFAAKVAKFPVRHPFLTALGIGAGLLWGVPYIARGIGAVEGGLASVPRGRIVDFFRRGVAPLSGTTPPAAMPRTLPSWSF